MGARVLIIDDEESIRFSLQGIFEDEGHEVFGISSAEEGLKYIEINNPDLIFLDIWLPKMDGLTALEEIQKMYPDLPIIMISGHGTIETAVTAIRQGAYDFIEKPLSLEKVLITANRAIEACLLRRENRRLRKALPETGQLLGESSAMLEFRKMLFCVAPTDAWVLLTGENGTGKELAARALHAGSSRVQEPLVAVNCAAIPEELIESELFGHEKGAFTGADSTRVGRFEMAHKGTLFLDEIADMSIKTQAKILRILQEQSFERLGSTRTIKVNVRVIAATNKNLEEAIGAGLFRKDLYYRLRVIPLHLPPLRDRGSDIELLLTTFVAQLCKQYGYKSPFFTKKSIDILKKYSWPGNVRELRNFTERMLILYAGKKICVNELPSEILGEAQSFKDTFYVEQIEGIPIQIPEDIEFKQAKTLFEAKYLSVKLQSCGGNVSRLAEIIGLERSYLHRKLKSYGIHSVE